jgi:hypothetical protein
LIGRLKKRVSILLPARQRGTKIDTCFFSVLARWVGVSGFLRGLLLVPRRAFFASFLAIEKKKFQKVFFLSPEWGA